MPGGVGGTPPRQGDVHTFGRSNVFSTYPLSFHILAHSFAPTKITTLFFSSDSALFAKNTRGWGAPSAPKFPPPRKQELAAGSIRTFFGSIPMRRRLIRIALILLLFPPLLAAVGGWLVAPGFLTPIRRELTPDLIREADASFAVTRSQREEFDVRASDGVLLRGWRVTPPQPNGSWVLLFHGVADNRVGVIGQSEFLLRAGYSVIMMDARAHGASEGPIATYGWLERNDARAIIDTLISYEFRSRISFQMSEPLHIPGMPVPAPRPFHIFALGESMGGGIALQSAAADPRIEAVVAESSFANLREASYDYAGLRKYPWLGKTLLSPFTWTLLYRGEKLSGLPVAEVSPVKAVASRAFPVLLICDEKDVALPCRHSEMIYAAARGPKQLWRVPGAFHSAALGFQPEEFKHRVLSFFATYANTPSPAPTTTPRATPASSSTLPSPAAAFPAAADTSSASPASSASPLSASISCSFLSARCAFSSSPASNSRFFFSPHSPLSAIPDARAGKSSRGVGPGNDRVKSDADVAAPSTIGMPT
jgi:uncharacterized protein